MGGVSGEVCNNMRHGAIFSRHYTRSKYLLVEVGKSGLTVSSVVKNVFFCQLECPLVVMERFYAHNLRNPLLLRLLIRCDFCNSVVKIITFCCFVC